MWRGWAGKHVHALQRGWSIRRAVAQALLRERRNLLRALLRHPAHMGNRVTRLSSPKGAKSPPAVHCLLSIDTFRTAKQSTRLKESWL